MVLENSILLDLLRSFKIKINDDAKHEAWTQVVFIR